MAIPTALKAMWFSGSQGWSRRWLDWRDRLLSSRVFQHHAAAFFLTRPTARRHARELFDLVAGFVYSQVLSACVKLRLFDRLADGPLPVEVLCDHIDLTPEAGRRLFAAAVSLRLLQWRADGRIGLGPLGAPMVGNLALTAMVEHHDALYADLADPLALLRRDRGRGALAGYWPYARDRSDPDGGRGTGGGTSGGTSGTSGASGADPTTDHVAAYTTLMAVSQSLVAQQILDAYPIDRHACLLDIGGGDGSFLVAASRSSRSTRLMLFDLPAVAQLARQRLAAAGLAHRSEVHGGSFLRDALPTGADLVTLIRVIHDHDDEAAMTVLRAARAALADGGRLLLAEPMAATRGAEPMGDAYFGFYLLAMGSGRPRSRAELTAMLQLAGFDRVVALKTDLPLQTSLLLASTGRQKTVRSRLAATHLM